MRIIKGDTETLEWNIINTIGVLRIRGLLGWNILKTNIHSDELREYFNNPELRGLLMILYEKDGQGDIKERLIQEKYHMVMPNDKCKGEESISMFMNNLPVPLIAAISGNCYGSFLRIALMSDMRLCTQESQFIFPEERGSFLPGIDIEYRWKLLVGKEKKISWKSISGKTIPAEEAVKIGFVNKVVGNNLLDDSLGFINKIVTEKDRYKITSIMRCFNVYKNQPEHVDAEILLEEESKQFCFLVYRDYYKSEEKRKQTINQNP